MGFDLISPIDLELDWRDLLKSGKKIALRGIYARIEEVDGLAVANKGPYSNYDCDCVGEGSTNFEALGAIA